MLDFKKGSIVHLTANVNGLTKGTPVKITKLIRHNAIELYEVQYQKNEPFCVVKCYVQK